MTSSVLQVLSQILRGVLSPPNDPKPLKPASASVKPLLIHARHKSDFSLETARWRRILQHLHVGLYCLEPFWDRHGELVVWHWWH